MTEYVYGFDASVDHAIDDTPVPDPRIVCLEEAARLTTGDRNRDYGSPVENMEHTARVFNAITGRDLSGREVAIMMQAVKLARRQVSPTKMDHYVDDMAYCGIEYECALAETEPKEAIAPHQVEALLDEEKQKRRAEFEAAKARMIADKEARTERLLAKAFGTA